MIYFAAGCILTATAAISISAIRQAQAAEREEKHFYQIHSIEYAEELLESRAAHEQELLFAEEKKIASSHFTPEETQRYMKFFIEGYHSNTGTIMIEGERNAPYERAFSRGYEMKRLLIKAYRLGILETKSELTNRSEQ